MVFLTLSLLFLFGCVQTLHNTSVSKNNKISVKKNCPADEGAAEEITDKSDTSIINKKLLSEDSAAGDAKKIEDIAEAAVTDEADEADENDADEDEADEDENLPVDKILKQALSFCETAQKLWEKGELENALKSLDEAYALIIGTDTEDAKLSLQKEDLRFTISKRILEIYASRHIVVKGKHHAIPMVMNSHVQAEIEALAGRGKCDADGFFIKAYKRSGRYRPYILEELKKAGLPAELSWLPLIESGFRVDALSPARALGLWQFIQSTGAKFGLKRDRYVDERLDPHKATKAAVAYLKELHQIFGDWTTVLAAYNCGEGKVLRVIREQNVNYLDNFWDLYERLPRETARYVPRFLATLHIVSHPEKYGIESVQTCAPPEYETVAISKQVHLKDVAKTLGIEERVLKSLNPELRYNIIPGSDYALKVPPQKDDILIASLDDIPVVSAPPKVRKKNVSRTRTTFKYHRVRRGETVSSIARKYHTDVKSILRANRLKRGNRIIAGRSLKVPVTSEYIAANKKSKAQRVSKHVVKKGDSLWNIAQRYGTTTKTIRALNRLSGSTLRIGQVLKISGAAKKKVSKTYRVKRGDVPKEIAKRYNISLERLLKMNQLTRRSKIYPGQKLYVD
jgi:membrane-bound lytic murein transglycosylase D